VSLAGRADVSSILPVAEALVVQDERDPLVRRLLDGDVVAEPLQALDGVVEWCPPIALVELLLPRSSYVVLARRALLTGPGRLDAAHPPLSEFVSVDVQPRPA
jgi:hypothetical protein